MIAVMYFGHVHITSSFIWIYERFCDSHWASMKQWQLVMHWLFRNASLYIGTILSIASLITSSVVWSAKPHYMIGLLALTMKHVPCEMLCIAIVRMCARCMGGTSISSHLFLYIYFTIYLTCKYRHKLLVSFLPFYLKWRYI